MRLVLAAVLGLLAVDARPAAACECALNDHPISPADGATGVPTNAAIFFPTAPEPVTGLALTDDAGHPIALTIAQHGTFLIARPSAALAANTTYHLTTQISAGTFQARFTTGDDADTTPPVFAGITAVEPETVGIAPDPNPTGGCQACGVTIHDGHVSRLHVDFADPPADAVIVATTVLDGDTALGEIGLPPGEWTGREIGFGNCGFAAPVLAPGASYCAKVTAYDAAGNAAGGETIACAVAASCKPAPDECTISETCEPMDDPPIGSPGGCATGRGPGLALALAALALARRRRGR